MIVLIPAYEPDGNLVDLVADLGHHTIVVVDDRVRALGAEVITLAGNRGKGFALKTGFAHIGTRYPGRDVICADSDGQHRPDDIDAVARHVADSGAAMVLGCRRFTGPVPARSRLGNTVTRAVFRLVTGLNLTDTQTGLRAYPARMLPWLCDVGGDRFEYEQRLLLRAARERLPVAQVEIATVYLRHNASSHFRPVRDSVRVLRPLLAFALSSLLAFAVDTAALLVLVALTDNLVLSAIGARLISATVNYGVNRAYVFGSRRSKADRRSSAVRYATLAFVLLAANIVLLEALALATGSVIVAKLLTEGTLAAVSFLAQRHVVFPVGSPFARRPGPHAVRFSPAGNRLPPHDPPIGVILHGATRAGRRH